MTREEYIDFANALKNNYTIDFDKLPEFCDMAVSVLSGGEYIKKSELLQHVTTEVLSDYKECDVIHAEVIDELPTYSIPPVATINVPEEKIQEFIHSKANVVSSESSDSAENKGEWIPLVAENGDDYIEAYDIAGVHTFAARYRCDKCGFIHFRIEDHGAYNFCPNCGADMRGE